MYRIRPRFHSELLAAFFSILLFLLLGISTDAQQIYINEFLASNVTINPDIVDFDDYSDWIEIYNAEPYSVSLGGYYLTDDLTNSKKWRIPASAVIPPNGFIRFWADGEDDSTGSVHVRDVEPFNQFTTTWYHLNFKLSKGGEELGIFAPDETKIDSVVYGLQTTDISYGRKPDGSDNWYYFGEPTPGESNTTQGVLQLDYADNVTFSIEAGVYQGSRTIILSTESQFATIRYTTDGSRPSSNSTLYNSPINLNFTTVVRARAFENNKLPGPIGTKSYMINETQSLPIISISAFPETLWDNQFGIYANSFKGRVIPISFEYFNFTGQLEISENCGLRISGQGSYVYPQKPFTITAYDRFGAEYLDYKFFPNRNIESFEEIYMRNSGTPDNRMTMFRDALQHSIVINQMDLDCQAYQPAETFINGQYWGIYNMREKVSAAYLAAHHNVDASNLDYLEYDFSQVPVVIEGSAESYNELLDFLRNNDLSSTENYDYVKSQIDIDEYINYHITGVFCDNINWHNTNVRWWRERTESAKWRWVLVDLDWGFGTVWPNFTSHYTNNSLKLAVSAPGTGLQHWTWATFLFRKLLESEEFKNEYIQRFAGYLNTVFRQQRLVHIVDSIKTMISGEMADHINRWRNSGPDQFGGVPIPSTVAWNNNVQVMRTFAERRTNYQRDHIVDFFNLSGTADLSINIAEQGAGFVDVNNVEINNNFDGIYFKDVPIKLKAVPNVGYRFAGWQGISSSTSDSISIILTNDSQLTALFVPSSENIIPPVILADTVLTAAGSPYVVARNVLVNPGVTLRVEPEVEILMPEKGNIYVNGSLLMEGTEASPIVIRPNSNAGVNNWGAVCFISATGASTISCTKLIGATAGSDKKNQIGAVSSFNSSLTLDNIEILDAPFPVFVQYGDVIVRNSSLHSEKTCDLINVKYANSALVENCDLRGNNSFDTDAIDYDQINSGIIRGNLIYNFFGSNSDGIDLGEESKNILIENNLVYNCFDKGVSVGQASTTTIRNNVFVNCAQGVGIKDDSSYAFIDRNTFYGCGYGVASFEKNLGAGGGNADVVNSIISSSKIRPYLLDNLSRLNISYSLSDTDELPGTGNFLSDPQFANNFYLRANSPAINSGDPNSATDPDGSRADMGAFPFVEGVVHLIINEVHFNPIEGEEYEFIELYNAGSSTLDLGGYRFTKGIDFTFVGNPLLVAGDYILIAKESDNYGNEQYRALEWIGDALPDNNWSIQLEDGSGKLIDFVTYGKYGDFPSLSNGGGSSLELRSSLRENIYYASWKASEEIGGSPGRSNLHSVSGELFINEVMAVNDNIIKDENDEYDDWIEIYNAGDSPVELAGLYLTDDFSNPTKYLIPSTDPDLTTVQPKDVILFWADEQSRQGELHVNFRLSSSGEQIGLVQATNNDTSFIDSLSYSGLSSDVSFGRIPDGSDSLVYFNLPTPGEVNLMPNLFERGILLVNGISFIYGTELTTSFNSKAYWGRFPITFWNCLESPIEGLPAILPDPIGHGPIPGNILNQFSTVIWLGNNYSGDIDCWELTPIKKYLQAGGNLFLLTRMGQNFINPELKEYLGINWIDTPYEYLGNCLAEHDSLTNIAVHENQNTAAVFSMSLTNSESTILFKETAVFGRARGTGVWHKPEHGGEYRDNGGQFVFLSGRPYRYGSSTLRTNVEHILANFFMESDSGNQDTSEIPEPVTEYSLKQNYPNPFNPNTTIKYDLPKDAKVVLKIYNILGQEVKTLVNEIQELGRKTVIWNGTNNIGLPVSSGVYICRIKVNSFGGAGDFVDMKKMVLIK